MLESAAAARVEMDPSAECASEPSQARFRQNFIVKKILCIFGWIQGCEALSFRSDLEWCVMCDWLYYTAACSVAKSL